MRVKVGNNGIGRIGRQLLRAALERHPDKLEIVAINDLANTETNAHLFKYDTNYGKFPGTVEVDNNSLIINNNVLTTFSERNPSEIPWSSVGVDLVIESTGVFTNAEKAAAHLNSGTKKVIISAPANGEDITIVIGVNDNKYDPKSHNIISNASCTTNCFAPMVKVLHQAFGIKYGLMSTIHAYTNDQKVLDVAHEDLRRSRAAAMNIIPTSTGAAKAVGLVIPELQGLSLIHI